MPRKIKDILHIYFSTETEHDLGTISLGGIDFATEDALQIEQLARSIVQCKHLGGINFRFVDFTGIAGAKLQPLFDAIKRKESIESLEFTHCRLGMTSIAGGMIELISFVLSKISLRHVSLSCNFTFENIGKGLPILRSILTNPQLESLEFNSNALYGLSSDMLNEMFQLLSRSNIRKLSLGANGFMKLTESSLSAF